MKQGKAWPDVSKWQAAASKASSRYGPLTIPFAFAVVPLLQVFGVENPVSFNNKFVQIPLFHYTMGEKQIYDHIMYMLNPRYVVCVGVCVES